MVYKIPRVELFVCIIKIPSRRGRTRTKNLQTMQWCELDVKLLFLGPLQIHFVSRPLGVYNSFLVLTPFFVLVWYRRQEDNDVTLMKLSSWIWIKLHPNIAVTSNSNNTIYEVPVTALLWPQQQQADGFGIHSEFFKNSSKLAGWIPNRISAHKSRSFLPNWYCDWLFFSLLLITIIKT